MTSRPVSSCGSRPAGPRHSGVDLLRLARPAGVPERTRARRRRAARADPGRSAPRTSSPPPTGPRGSGSSCAARACGSGANAWSGSCASTDCRARTCGGVGATARSGRTRTSGGEQLHIVEGATPVKIAQRYVTTSRSGCGCGWSERGDRLALGADRRARPTGPHALHPPVRAQ